MPDFVADATSLAGPKTDGAPPTAGYLYASEYNALRQAVLDLRTHMVAQLGSTGAGDTSGSQGQPGRVVALRGKALDAVTMGTPADGDVVAYDAAAAAWKAAPPAASASERLCHVVLAFAQPTTIAEFLVTPSITLNANYPPYTSGATSPLGAPDLLLTWNDSAFPQVLRWRLLYTNAVAMGVSVLTLRRFPAGAWATAGTQALSNGTQSYSGTVSLAVGEGFGAHMTLDPGQPTAFDSLTFLIG